MNNKNNMDRIKRREFLQTGATVAASVMLAGLGGTKLFAAVNYAQQRHHNANARIWHNDD
jgi:TAT (twin-arginine translocation) pathway signal sequence